MSIEDWRSEIDEIDKELLRLLNRRAQMAIQVGLIKQREGLPVCDPEREREVVARLCSTTTGPLDEAAVIRIFRHIIQESKDLQTKLSNSSLGAATEQDK